MKIFFHDETLMRVFICAPDNNNSKQESKDIFNKISEVGETLPQNQLVIILGDFDVYSGNKVVPGKNQYYNEAIPKLKRRANDKHLL